VNILEFPHFYLFKLILTCIHKRQNAHSISFITKNKEVNGYDIEASDGNIGHVEDFILEDKTWALRYVVVDTRNWLPGGKKVMLSLNWVKKSVGRNQPFFWISVKRRLRIVLNLTLNNRLKLSMKLNCTTIMVGLLKKISRKSFRQ
jgi:hypothetical protein